jgi:hypothetical protein
LSVDALSQYIDPSMLTASPELAPPGVVTGTSRHEVSLQGLFYR